MILGWIIPTSYKEEQPTAVQNLKICMPDPSEPEGNRKLYCESTLPPLSGKVLVCGRIINPSKDPYGLGYYLKKDGEKYPVDHGNFAGSEEIIDFCENVSLDSPDRSGNYTFKIFHYRVMIASADFQILEE